MREELEDQLQVKEATLMEYLEDQRQNLLKEKADVEQRLKGELESALEKDKALADELEKQKQSLEKVTICFQLLIHSLINKTICWLAVKLAKLRKEFL